MPFVKGQSGNAKGRPRKGESFGALLERELAKKYRDELTKKQRIVQIAVDQACVGNMQAMQWVVERTEGKVPDKSEQSGELRINVRYEDVGKDERGSG